MKAKNSGKTWSSNEKQQLKSLARGNTPTRVIALKLGRTPTAIYAKAHEQDVSLKPTNQRPYGTLKR